MLKQLILLSFTLILILIPTILSLQETTVPFHIQTNDTLARNLTITAYNTTNCANTLYNETFENKFESGDAFVVIGATSGIPLQLDHNNDTFFEFYSDGTILNFTNATEIRSGDTTCLAIRAGQGEVDASDIDTASVQRRVLGTCAGGTSIRVIAEDGTVTCETDDTGAGLFEDNSGLITNSTATGLNITNLTVNGELNVTGAIFSNDWTNISILLSQIVSYTNSSAFVNNISIDNCPGGTLVIGVQSNGSLECAADADSGGAGLFEAIGNVISNSTADSLNITNVDVTGTLINMTAEDSSLRFWYRERDTFSEGQAIELYSKTGEAKPYIGWYNQTDGVGWLGCHYNLSNGDVHEHCSFETRLDDGMNTRFEIEYGGAVADNNARFSSLGNLILGTSMDLQLTGSSSDIEGTAEVDIYPYNQASIALRVANNTNDLVLSGLGTSLIEVQDSLRFSNGRNISMGVGGFFAGSLDCTNITGGSDGDFCADADSGGGGLFTAVGNVITNDTASFLNVSGLNVSGAIQAGDWSNVSGHTIDTDTNASECATGTILLGDGTCEDLNLTISNWGVTVGFNASGDITSEIVNSSIGDFGRIIGFNSTFNASYAALNSTDSIQQLLNSTGIYSTFNATYDANVDTNASACSSGEFLIGDGTCHDFNNTLSEWGVTVGFNVSTGLTSTEVNSSIGHFGRIIGFNSTYNASYAALNSTDSIQQLLNSTGIYSTFNTTYDANTDTNASACAVSEYLDGGGHCISINNTISNWGVSIGFNATAAGGGLFAAQGNSIVNFTAVAMNISNLTIQNVLQSNNWTNVSGLLDPQISDTLTIGASGSVDDGALTANICLLDTDQTFTSSKTFNLDPVLTDEVNLTLGSSNDVEHKWNGSDYIINVTSGGNIIFQF